MGYQRLREPLPDVTRFTLDFGKNRRDGKQSHDRFALDYHDDLNVAQPCKEFVTELRGKKYQAFLCRLLNVRSLKLRFLWHYTPNGCSVSPHCGVELKLATEISCLIPNQYRIVGPDQVRKYVSVTCVDAWL